MPFPIILVVFLVTIAVVNGFAVSNHWYWTLRWLDMPMHFAGGMWLASFGVWWQYRRQKITPQSFPALFGVCFIYALSVGLLWEAYEAVISFFTVGHMNAIPDTLSDLLFDILGGTIVSILVWMQARLK